VARRAPQRSTGSDYIPGTIAVTYRTTASTGAIDAAMHKVGGAMTAQLDFSRSALKTRVISVDPSRTSEALRELKSVPGIRSAIRLSYRHRMAVTSNDPYYDGFGPGAPYFQDSQNAGQWDMHVINIEGAWNDVASSGPVNGAPIAIVDTGVDLTHPELTGGKVIRARCFVTYPASSAQSSGPYVTDTDGHGTDVAGLADANTNNAVGFASAGFNAPLLAYRIFPSDPAGGCENSTSSQCSASSADEASAINDAVSNGAKVINLSLGYDPKGAACDPNDPEYIAVENAISHNVVVVAASGNEGNAALDCPAADPGVIAVGASAINDATTTITEKVASYSNWVSGNNGGTYMVAPGGDPDSSDTSGSTTDYLHWIENIYSSTAVQKGTCGADLNATNGISDCRILIAGTSMATPHVVGVVSLILAVKPSYTPQQVAQALCTTADEINDTKEGCGRINAAAAVEYAKTH
jgi:subtilisin family serine protease